ncbi:MAG TPA: hypothetical protein VIL55_14560 [Naasia sp.]|jgi:cytochrome c oxidase assembly factor CtaG
MDLLPNERWPRPFNAWQFYLVLGVCGVMLGLVMVAGIVQGIIAGDDVSQSPSLFMGLVVAVFSATYSFTTMVKLRRAGSARRKAQELGE